MAQTSHLTMGFSRQSRIIVLTVGALSDILRTKTGLRPQAWKIWRKSCLEISGRRCSCQDGKPLDSIGEMDGNG